MSNGTNDTTDDIKKSSVEQTVAVDSLTILGILLIFSCLAGIVGISIYCVMMKKKRKKLISESPYSGTALDSDSYIRYGSPGYYRKPDLEVPPKKNKNRSFSELSSVRQMANEIWLTNHTHCSTSKDSSTIEGRLDLPSLERDDFVNCNRSSTYCSGLKERNGFHSSQFRISCSNVPEFSDSVLAHNDEEILASCIKKSPSLTPLFTPCDEGIICSASTLATNPDFVSANLTLQMKFVSNGSNLVSELNSCQSIPTVRINMNQVIEFNLNKPKCWKYETISRWEYETRKKHSIQNRNTMRSI